jgi:glycosyltransferase involved in cell wall biosynthesis
MICEPNASALADAIEHLVLNPERAKALGQTGRQAVMEKFSSRHMARNIVSAFQELSRPTVATIREREPSLRP